MNHTDRNKMIKYASQLKFECLVECLGCISFGSICHQSLHHIHIIIIFFFVIFDSIKTHEQPIDQSNKNEKETETLKRRDKDTKRERGNNE